MRLLGDLGQGHREPARLLDVHGPSITQSPTGLVSRERERFSFTIGTRGAFAPKLKRTRECFAAACRSSPS